MTMKTAMPPMSASPKSAPAITLPTSLPSGASTMSMMGTTTISVQNGVKMVDSVSGMCLRMNFSTT